MRTVKFLFSTQEKTMEESTNKFLNFDEFSKNLLKLQRDLSGIFIECETGMCSKKRTCTKVLIKIIGFERLILNHSSGLTTPSNRPISIDIMKFRRFIRRLNVNTRCSILNTQDRLDFLDFSLEIFNKILNYFTNLILI